LSYPTHLTKVNNTFYYRIKVPVDLQQYFPCGIIKKSLKTDDIRSAKTLLIAIEYNTNKCFMLLRTGMLPDDMAKQLVESVLPIRQKTEVSKGKILSEVTKQYVMAKESGWTAKSDMSASSQ
jgi:hypothetical protein